MHNAWSLNAAKATPLKSNNTLVLLRLATCYVALLLFSDNILYDGLEKLDSNFVTLKFLSHEKIKKNI